MMPLRIAFFASEFGEMEAEVIQLSEALKHLGHEVFVLRKVHEIRDTNKLDVFIAVRDWISLLHPVEAKYKILWTIETPDQFSTMGLGDLRVVRRMQALFAASDAQAKLLSDASGFPLEKIFILGALSSGAIAQRLDAYLANAMR